VEEVSHYTVTAERGRLYWVLQAVEAPNAITEVARLSQASEFMPEAISIATGEPEDEIEFEIVPVASEVAQNHIANARRMREQAARANEAAATEWRAAARELRTSGMTYADIGAVLDVSPQRAAQLVSA